jgi:hypothetical protein
MPGFLYYLPAKRDIKLAELVALGLGYAFEKPSFTRCEIHANGPDKGAGVIVADDTRLVGHRVGYYADEQEWVKVPKTNAYVGWFKADPPTPTDLERSQTLNGHLVELGDGNEWLVPVARGAAEEGWYTALPQRTGLDDNGEWASGKVIARYEALWDAACRFWDAFRSANDVEGEAVQLDFAGQNDAALVALQANYRVGRAEVVALGLFDGQCVVRILQALIDWPTWLELHKKKVTSETSAAPASLNTDDGPPGDGPATAQP